MFNGQSRKRALPDTDYETWLAEAEDRDALVFAMSERAESGSVVTDAELLPKHVNTFSSRRMATLGQFVEDDDENSGSDWKFAFRDPKDNELLALNMDRYFPFSKTATGVRVCLNFV